MAERTGRFLLLGPGEEEVQVTRREVCLGLAGGRPTDRERRVPWLRLPFSPRESGTGWKRVAFKGIRDVVARYSPQNSYKVQYGSWELGAGARL